MVVPVVSAKNPRLFVKIWLEILNMGLPHKKATVIYGSLDFAINQIYPTINALMFAELYGIPKENRREFSIERLKDTILVVMDMSIGICKIDFG